MAEKAGRKCPELIQPEIPKSIFYLWRWFCEISQGRPEGLLRWSEIKAWSDLTGKMPNDWELSTIRAIDREYLNG